MKVKELIEELQKLEQERNIWIIYDGYEAYVPSPEIADKYQVGTYHNGVTVEEGDYTLFS